MYATPFPPPRFVASSLAGHASPQGLYITSYYRHCTLAFSLLTHVFFMYDTVMNLMRVVHSMLRVQPMEPRWPLSCAFSFAIRRGSFTPGLSLVWVHLSVTGLPFIYFLAPLSTTMRSLSNVVFIISLLITCITTWQFTDWFSLPRTNVVRISFRLGPSLRSPKRLIILRFLFFFFHLPRLSFLS